MIRSFRCPHTERLFDGRRVSKFASIERAARRELEILAAAQTLEDLKSPPGNRLEKLKGDRTGQYSIRINNQFRICFSWDKAARNVEIVDYH